MAVERWRHILVSAGLWLSLGISLWRSGRRQRRLERKIEALYQKGLAFSHPRMLSLHRRLVKEKERFLALEKTYGFRKLQALFPGKEFFPAPSFQNPFDGS